MVINAFGLAGLLVGLSSLFMSIFVLIKGHGKKLNNIWAFYSFCVSLWGFGALKISTITDPSKAFLWWRLTFVGIIFLPISFFHFVCIYTNIKRKTLILTGYISALMFLIINLANKKLFIGNIKFLFNQFYWVTPPGPLLNLFIFSSVFGLIIYSHFLLFKNLQRTNDFRQRMQTIYFLIGSSTGWIGGFFCFLPCYNIMLYPYGAYGAILYPFIMGYAVVYHQLFNIEVIIKKTLVYSIIITIITTLYFVIVYLLEKIFSTIAGYRSIPLTIALIALFSIIFVPLKNKVQKFIDKYFFHGTIDQIDEENIKLREELQKSEKLKAVATLAAGMAHEIKNPLTSIKTFNEYLPLKYSDPDFIKKFNNIVGGEVQKINYIVRQLLEFSKPSEPKLEESNVIKLMDETLDLLNNDILKHNIKLNKNYSSTPPLKIDPLQMKQAFLNILLNAIESMKNGGIITVEIKTDKDASITIKDTGCGIGKEDLKNIFDPFFSKKDTGTGLGLSVVHGIVEKHGGKINVKSIPRKGTSFTILLPLSEN